VDIGAWLHGHGLGQYEPAFRANDIDAATLPDLTADDLIALGIASVGHRRRLLAAIGRLAAAPAPECAQAGGPARQAERRQLTIMFVDLVGSTALASRLDPEVMGDLLRAYQNCVAGEITRLEGHVAKFLGDGVLAYFGWPRAHEDEAERAVRAGRAIVAAVGRLAAGEPLACRVGIATGPVVVGDLVGTGSAREEVVVGETPNLAARLQAIAAPGQVLVADRTRQLLGDLFALEALPPLAIHGLPGPIVAHAVIAERVAASRFAARQGGELTPLVGREQELALLLERWRQAGSGEGQLVLLTGEAGIGKSRIVEALAAAVAATSQAVVRFQCTPYHSESALYPASQFLVQATGDGGADARRARLAALLAGVGPAAAESVDLMAPLLGLDVPEPPDLSPLQRRTRTLALLCELLPTRSARRWAGWSRRSWSSVAARRRTRPTCSSTRWSATPPTRACSRASARPSTRGSRTFSRHAATRRPRSPHATPRPPGRPAAPSHSGRRPASAPWPGRPTARR
jgi:class 3 adenylate cyclase